MSKSSVAVVLGVLVVLGGLTVALVSGQAEAIPLPATISGTVSGTDGPLADALVQLKGTPNITQTAADGTFTLTGIEGDAPAVVTAWFEGYYVGWATLDPSAADWPGSEAIHISLRPLFEGDNLDYHWFSFEGVTGSASCGQCHREYDEWTSDQHSRAAVNTLFLNMYTGEDINGNRGEITEFGSDGLPKPLDPNEPNYGPGFMLDNPGRAGNCAACHTPLASNSPNTQNCAWSGCHTSLTIERSNGIIAPHAMPTSLTGDAGEGITCDFCHKIGDVYLDPETGLPYPDMPGIMSLRLYRPPEGEQVFFGTLVDVDRRDTYLPLLSTSEYCAGCHFGVFGGIVGMGEVVGGTVIYNSYGEWLESPYSDPETGKTCQDCHMPVSDANWFVYPEKGGIERDYAELHNHTMPGAADDHLLQNTVTLAATAERSDDQLSVEVRITNDQAGHHVPTDFPSRSMILVIEALDANGQLLVQSAGPVNPAYSGDYGGLPGKTFAKVLRDEWSGEMPTAAIWRPVTIVEDTRLAALETDTTAYTFAAPAGQAVTVNVRLLFRRAFYELMQQKGWTIPDILMEHETLTVPAN